MKKLIGIFLVIVYFTISGFAQENQVRLNPLSTQKDIKFGSFGGPIFLTSTFNNNFNLGVGGGGGILINDFYIGVFGIGQQFDKSVVEVTQEAQQIDVSYAGLWLGYTFLNDYRLHPLLSLRTGLGGLEIKEKDAALMRENMVVLTPEFGVEFNITEEFRVGNTLGYRWLSGFDERKLPREDYSGMILNTTLRVVIK